MMTTRIDTGGELDPETVSAAQERPAKMGMHQTPDGERLQFREVGAEQQATDNRNVQQREPKPATAPKERATKIPGKCGHCSRYWSAHDVVGNQAKCRGAAFAGKTFTREVAKVEAPAPVAAGVLTAEQVDALQDITNRLMSAKLVLAGDQRRVDDLQAEYEQHLDSLRAK